MTTTEVLTIQPSLANVNSSFEPLTADQQMELADIEALGLPNMAEATQMSMLINAGVAPAQRGLHVRPPLPGRYTTRVGERIGQLELLPMVDEWAKRAGNDGGFIVQGGNRYISTYLAESGHETIDLKVMSIDKAPLHTQLVTLLSASERHEVLDQSTVEAIEASLPPSTGIKVEGLTREQLLRALAADTVPSPFQANTSDEDLESELSAAVDVIQSGDLPYKNAQAIREVLAGTKLAASIRGADELHFLDDLFYRGRTLLSLAAIVKAFGGDPQAIRLTTLACDRKSVGLESPYHRVLLPGKLYPFENSIRTEQGYWQDIGGRYVFTDMAGYWEHLDATGESSDTRPEYTEWQNQLTEWYRSHVPGGEDADITLVQPLLWLSVYHAAHGIEQNVDKVVDQKGYKIGACTPFTQLIDRFISQEETVEARKAFKNEVRNMLLAIKDAALAHPDSFESLVSTYIEKQRTLDYHGLEFMFQNETQAVGKRDVSEQYAGMVARVSESLRSRAAEMPRPLIVGINGVDTSGKTELTAAIAACLQQYGLGVSMVHIDDFTHPAEVRHSGQDPVDNYYNKTFDIDTLRRRILQPIVQGYLPRVVLQHVDPRDDNRQVGHTYDIQPSPSVVLVEGVFIFRPEIRGYFDYSIFLEMPLDNMMLRAVQRDVPRFGFAALRKYRDKYMPAQIRYIAETRPGDGADAIIECSDWQMPVLKRIS